MIDLNLLRSKPSFVVEKINSKDPDFDIEGMIKLEAQVRALKIKIDDLRFQKNNLSKKITQANITSDIREESKLLGEKIKGLESELNSLDKRFHALYFSCPNIPFEEVPVGDKEKNQVLSSFLNHPNFSFKPRNHVELSDLSGWVDFEGAAQISGSQFALYRNGGVDLICALAMFMVNHNKSHGYSPVLPPYIVNSRSLEYSGNFPRFKDDVYSFDKDDLHLIPTSEVSLLNIYRNKIFQSSELPVRLTAFTSCFRREAGGYGANERGLIRLHQFEKAELFTFSHPDKSKDEQERMLSCAESILQKLGLHYRVSLLSTQDTSFSSSKTCDLEVWLPGQKDYREVASISNCTDFQARRASIRFREKDKSKSTRFVHTLNGSSLAIPRLMVAIMETYQQEDGSVTIPEVLRNVSVKI